jgi:RNA polymerase sigma-70 factor (ECF subfamily)
MLWYAPILALYWMARPPGRAAGEDPPMADGPPETSEIQGYLQRLRAGDAAARDELLGRICDRLRRLARKMLKGFPGVKRYAETDDVLQNALLRLLRALQQVQPDSARELFGLAATQIRRELLDLAKHFYGPQGAGAHHASRPPAGDSAPPAYEKADVTYEPSALAEWCELHEQVEKLPADEREAVDLLYYQGLSQAEAAALLNISVRTLQRRWQAAVLRLHEVLQGRMPGL